MNGTRGASLCLISRTLKWGRSSGYAFAVSSHIAPPNSASYGVRCIELDLNDGFQDLLLGRDHFSISQPYAPGWSAISTCSTMVKPPKLPNLQVELDHPEIPYRPGDVLKGNLRLSDILESKKNIGGLLRSDKANDANIGSGNDFSVANLEEVLLRLSGDAVILSVHRDEIRRASSVPLISTVSSIAPNKTGEWRFEIEIPRMTDSSLERTGLPPPSDPSRTYRFAADHAHPLPPTAPLIDGRSMTSGLCGAIGYSLIPVGMRFRGGEIISSLSKAQVGAPVWIVQNYPTAAAMDNLEGNPAHAKGNFVVRSKKLLKGLNGAQTQTPTIDCQATFSGPACVRPGREYSLDITVKIVKTPLPELDPSKVSLSLKFLKIKFQRLLGTSYAGKVNLRRIDLYTTELIGKESHVIEGRPDNYVPYQRNVDLHLGRVRWLTDFETFNISVSHVLVVEATFECAGEKKKQRVEIPIKVLPRPRLATDQGETAGFVEGPQNVNEKWGSPIDKTLHGHNPLGMVAAGLAFNAADLTLSILQVAGTAACTIM